MDKLDLVVASAVVRFTFIGGKDFDKGIFFGGSKLSEPMFGCF